jgi:hypothetical protein
MRQRFFHYFFYIATPFLMYFYKYGYFFSYFKNWVLTKLEKCKKYRFNPLRFIFLSLMFPFNLFKYIFFPQNQRYFKIISRYKPNFFFRFLRFFFSKIKIFFSSLNFWVAFCFRTVFLFFYYSSMCLFCLKVYFENDYLYKQLKYFEYDYFSVAVIKRTYSFFFYYLIEGLSFFLEILLLFLNIKKVVLY